MYHTRITFNAIQTNDLLYFDPEFEELCLKFCKERNIDCLPDLDDPLKFYRRTEHGFIKDDVAQERRVSGQDDIFAIGMLELFRANHLLFVYENDKLTGVVHFSDYNKNEVDAYLFGLLSSFERSVRRFLKLHGLKNQDMLNFFESKVEKANNKTDKDFFLRKIADYQNKQEQNEKLTVFECFYLLDLIGLVNHHKIISISEDANKLRNTIMHAKELVNKDDASQGDFIYNFSSFEIFFKQVSKSLVDYKRVNNKIAYLELSRG